MSFWEKAGRAAIAAAMGKSNQAPAAAQPSAPRKSRSYRVGLVGESNYQAAIKRCSEGEGVQLLHEPDNPYDENAIVVVCRRGKTIGYLPRDSFVHSASLEEGKGCQATIDGIQDGTKGLRGVVLEVALCAGPIGRRRFARA